MKTLNKILFGGILFCSSILKADFFEFPQESTLSEEQQNVIKKLFLVNLKDGICSLADPNILASIIKAHKNNKTQTLHNIILDYLIKPEHKSGNFYAIIKNTEDIFKETLQNTINESKDGLFNCIIIKTLSEFKSTITPRNTICKKLHESSDVLWNAVASKKSINLDMDTLNKILELYPDLNFEELIQELPESLPIENLLNNFPIKKLLQNPNKSFCEKIADILASVLEQKIDEGIEQSCCSCCSGCCITTLGFAKDIALAIIPYIPAILQVTLAIITAVA